ncbi:MAG: metal-dependent transcriptional regulator [Acidobacteriota bacterium]
MKIAHVTDEVIETIWRFEEKGGCTLGDVKKAHENSAGFIVDDDVLADMARSGLVTISGTGIALTSEGQGQGQLIVRRHRLAERLLVDILGTPFDEMEVSACEFEHTLAPGLTEAICTLLGHPRECPHGAAIPPGDCCTRTVTAVTTVVKSLDALDVGDEIRVSFVRIDNPVLIGKLLSFGVAPGKTIKLRQKSPAFVIQIESSQIALEREIAAGICGLKIN